MMVMRALGAEPPVYAHIPLILGPDRKRLSKRQEELLRELAACDETDVAERRRSFLDKLKEFVVGTKEG